MFSVVSTHVASKRLLATSLPTQILGWINPQNAPFLHTSTGWWGSVHYYKH
ncbi:hypothetical protein [Entomospira culicis]|uniref:Uncharacterized protein n=1 Tax=Entomospira culicis TaxID=2719989 RepID=A0A968KWR6_9SPIO|nr:hypothetical protein [Entomospira culicis]NIZ19548.1 hypothetical protein [Entomospira culicis]NIZ69547.1 hypothetical protein [Entomospira culicis]WDI36658.1 hypothetical protein PVA46_04860 [Entomospira culicis]WDI38287.1 hypothetical protein PVA47_04870 [Entomospira culicis]